MEAQKNHKEELQNIITTVLNDVTTAYEQCFQQLHQILDKQSIFLRSQFAANLSWRLAHHHSEISKNLNLNTRQASISEKLERVRTRPQGKHP